MVKKMIIIFITIIFVFLLINGFTIWGIILFFSWRSIFSK